MLSNIRRRDVTEKSSSNIEVKRRKLKSSLVTDGSNSSSIKHIENTTGNKNSANFQVNIPKHMFPQSPSPPSPAQRQRHISPFILQSPPSPQSLQEKDEDKSNDTQMLQSSIASATSEKSNIPKPSIQQPKISKSLKTSEYETIPKPTFSKVGKENTPTNQWKKTNNTTEQNKSKSVRLDKQINIFTKKNGKNTSIFTTKPRSKIKVFTDETAAEEEVIKATSVCDKYRYLAETSKTASDIRNDISSNDSHQEYIINLPNECLYSIFMYCDDLTTKCTLTRVCKRWRLLMLDGSNWKKATTSLMDFKHCISTLTNPKKSHCYHQHIQKLTTLHIDEHAFTRILHPGMEFPKLIPFIQLSSLKLDHVFYSDIQYIIVWLGPVIRRLECRNIRLDEHKNVRLVDFSNMRQLRVLILEFQQRCAHIQSRIFNLTGRPLVIGRNFVKLKVLSFLNYHDTEEYVTPSIDTWYDMERALHSKYDIFSIMKELQSLTLTRCNAFTASIWRECFVPCASGLRRLSLTGWEGRGCRQSPMQMALLERRANSEWVNGARIPDEVELALADFISGLVSIKSIYLNDFYCGYGLVLGLDRLGKTYKLCDGDDVIDGYMDTRLNQFKITFI